MKKVFFAFVATSVMALAACNNKPAEEATEAAATETTEAVSNAVETTAAAVDTAVAAITDTTTKK
ncbi:MAG: hypothetical protein IPP77_06640 [Bacteroidetes bacterium]|nr:hypothetical protein [Bacteroidota bacterium]